MRRWGDKDHCIETNLVSIINHDLNQVEVEFKPSRLAEICKDRTWGLSIIRTESNVKLLNRRVPVEPSGT